MSRAVCADSEAAVDNDWIEISPTAVTVDKAGDPRETSITSHLMSARHLLDDISGRIAAMKMSDTDIKVTTTMFDAAVSFCLLCRNGCQEKSQLPKTHGHSKTTEI